eukprot:scaffold17053_cov78-Phaeocystis_antarctica.AAC.1
MGGSGCALQRSGSRTGSTSSRALDSGPPALLDSRVRGSGWWLSKTKEAFLLFRPLMAPQTKGRSLGQTWIPDLGSSM